MSSCIKQKKSLSMKIFSKPTMKPAEWKENYRLQLGLISPSLTSTFQQVMLHSKSSQFSHTAELFQHIFSLSLASWVIQLLQDGNFFRLQTLCRNIIDAKWIVINLLKKITRQMRFFRSECGWDVKKWCWHFIPFGWIQKKGFLCFWIIDTVSLLSSQTGVVYEAG